MPQTMSVQAANTTAEAAEAVELIACPHCGAQLMFGRSRIPLIDACGFESYYFHCSACGGALGGVIDPADDTLQLSALAA
jgi:DNA-directed RNA polymerase subunit RPC12/RpoP